MTVPWRLKHLESTTCFLLIGSVQSAYRPILDETNEVNREIYMGKLPYLSVKITQTTKTQEVYDTSQCTWMSQEVRINV